jgi:hypothetical protein
VGASLLAKAVHQATSSSTESPLSRAGSLPQWGIFALLAARKQNAASTRGGSGRGKSLSRSMHEQGDQDDDRDGHAKKKQK